MTETKMYEVKKICDNCSKIEKFSIPKGTPFNEFERQNKCENCGC
jgi:hypothetical protein